MRALLIGRRAGMLVAALAATLAFAVCADLLFGPFLDAHLLGALGLLTTTILIAGYVMSQRRARDVEGGTERLTQLTVELESFIAKLEADNARAHASEARYKCLVDSQGDAILRRTPDGRMTYANEGFFKLFGLKPEQVIGQSFHPEPHPDSQVPLFGRLVGRETGRECVSYDQHLKTIAGYRWIAWEDYAIRDAEGQLVEIQSVGRDVTERKGLESALTDSRDKAENANRAKSRFLATMSHEIRTPMNGVLGMARLLLETQLAPDQKTYAEAIKQSGVSLLALIEDILDFYKIESGALQLEPGEVTLRPLIEGIVELLSTRAHAKGIEITTAIDANVPATLKADPVRLRQVLTNLVGNAVKFTEEGGVLVSASLDADRPRGSAMIRFCVRDTGIGVPAEKQTQIFEDFVQVDSSQSRRFEGTGLGLSISRHLVEAMGGRIGMSSAEDRGSIFWVTLPIDEPVPSEQPRVLAERRVTLVSRSSILKLGLKLQLAAAGAEVTEVDSVETLWRQPHNGDLVLIDAAESDSELVADVSEIDVPVVTLLPPGRRSILTELGELGYSGYLMKPVRQESLEKRLSAVLAGKEELTVAVSAPEVRWRPVTGLSILLAEDNAINALLARELLRRRGHTVEAVTNGEAAVAACSRRPFDLVIMDLHMPGLDGLEATRRIRLAESKTGSKSVPIFALTADALETGRKACLEAGMDGFLTKPLDPVELDNVLATVVPPATIAA